MLANKFQRHEILDEEIARHIKGIESADNLVSYLEATAVDQTDIVNLLFAASRAPRHKPLHEIEYEILDSFLFQAYAMISSKQKVEFALSRGLFYAFDDMFMRLSCNKGFYAYEFSERDFPSWDGCQCLWLCDGIFEPMIRYYDYRLRGNRSDGSFLNGFFSAIPLDKQRQKLARFMSNIAILWVMMHEESHYFDGHLILLEQGYSKHNPRVMLNETSVESDSVEHQRQLQNKLFEARADRFASEAITDIIVQKEVFEFLPSYCQKNKKVWLLRLVLTTVCSVIAIFQKSRLIHGSTNHYPSPKTRMIISIRSILARLNSSHFASKLEYTSEDMLSAVVGTFDDIYNAEVVLASKSDAIELSEELDKFKPEEFIHNLNLFKNDSEILILANMLFGIDDNSASAHIDNIKENWIAEMDYLHQHDPYLYEKLSSITQDLRY